jgi:hypothetical protein
VVIELPTFVFNHDHQKRCNNVLVLVTFPHACIKNGNLPVYPEREAITLEKAGDETLRINWMDFFDRDDRE